MDDHFDYAEAEVTKYLTSGEYKSHFDGYIREKSKAIYTKTIFRNNLFE